MEFNIEDRVEIIATGKCGRVVDRLYSEARGTYSYVVQMDGSENRGVFQGKELELIPEIPANYHYEITKADNDVIVVVLYETVNGVTKEISRGHGHILHEGAIGYAQAVSYAMKKSYINMNGGELLIYHKEEEDETV